MKKLSKLTLLGILCSASVFASEVISVSINTSSIIGTSGTLDLQFNPVNTPQAATAVVQSFLTDGTLSGSPTLTGDVTGALPGSLTFDNGTAFNDYFQNFTFGNSITFGVLFSGPAIDSPDGNGLNSSLFSASLADSLGNTLLTTDPTGALVTIGINVDGSLNPTATSANAFFPAPEPASFALLGLGLIALRIGYRRASR